MSRYLAVDVGQVDLYFSDLAQQMIEEHSDAAFISALADAAATLAKFSKSADERVKAARAAEALRAAVVAVEEAWR